MYICATEITFVTHCCARRRSQWLQPTSRVILMLGPEMFCYVGHIWGGNHGIRCSVKISRQGHGCLTERGPVVSRRSSRRCWSLIRGTPRTDWPRLKSRGRDSSYATTNAAAAVVEKALTNNRVRMRVDILARRCSKKRYFRQRPITR